MSEMKEKISKSYAKLLNDKKSGDASCCGDQGETSCCGEQGEISFGCYYMDSELNHFLRPGMTVIDFGSAPGKDLLLSAEIIGPTGKAIGVDMTEEMIAELQFNAEKRNLKNVSAVKSDIETIPLDSDIADIIISNCVINLATDKQKVFNEAFRLLKSGGILLDADVIAEEEFSIEMQENNELWCSCVGGALTEDKYKELLKNAGFKDIEVKYAGKGQVQFEAKSYGILSGLIFARKP